MPSMTDEQKLKLFVRRCQELVECRIWREGGLSVRLSFAASGVTLDEPDKDNLRSFLTLFRQMIARREPVFIETIIELAKSRLAPDHASDAQQFDEYLQKWNSALQRSGLSIIVDGETLSPKHVLETYIDGEYFHNDVNDREELARFAKFGVRVDRVRFIQTLADLTEIILNVGNAIGYGLQHKWFTLT
jgi:hypothetical protein